ncbi:hypothetical protein Bca4012_032498 [Brassica carinata]
MRTWPENRDIVRSLALRYIQLDQAKRRKKSVNLYEFLNKNKDNKTMLNKFKKRNVEELKYPISDHYTPDQINQLIHSLEQSYSKLQERRRFLAAKANLDDRQHSLNPNHFTKYPQESCVYDQNNNNYNFQHLCLSDYSTLHYQLMPYGGSDQNMMCMVNNFQHPCVSSNTTDYSVFPLELQESVSNYELNQLMPHELNYGFDQNMSATLKIHVSQMTSALILPTAATLKIYPSFSHDFNPVMSSSYVDENRLLRASTLPYL